MKLSIEEQERLLNLNEHEEDREREVSYRILKSLEIDDVYCNIMKTHHILFAMSMFDHIIKERNKQHNVTQ